MASVTSYFNPTLWKKSMHRFWPLWTAYLVFWLFLIPLNLLQRYFEYIPRYDHQQALLVDRLLDRVHDIPQMLEACVWLAAAYGLLCAMAVFGYLYNNRSAAMMHTLPLRRESLFCTQYAAGLSYFLLPHLAVAALTAPILLAVLPSYAWGEAFGAIGVWLLVQTATTLFFFSFASFCAMFTGHVIALPVFFGILNGLVMGIYALITELTCELFFGMTYFSFENPLVMACTPLYKLTDACRWRAVREEVLENGAYVSKVVDHYLASPGTVAAYALAGLVFAALATLVYRRHHVETAGDVVSVPVVRPIFRVGVAFCAGLAFGTFTSAFFGWFDSVLIIPAILVWTVVGWFAAEMLLKKSFRVLKCWKGSLAMTAAMLLICLSLIFDWFGVEARVPDADRVSGVTVSLDMGAPYDGAYLSEAFLDPEDIRTFLAIHQAIVDNRDYYKSSPAGDAHVNISLLYDLNNGTTMRRNYYLSLSRQELQQADSVASLLQNLYSDRDMVRLAYGMDDLAYGKPVGACLFNVYDKSTQDIVRVDLDTVTRQDLERLWTTVQQDFEEGTLGVRYLFADEERYENTYYTDLRLQFELPRNPERWGEISQTLEVTDLGVVSANLNITLTPNARNTLNWFKTSGALGDRYSIADHDLYHQIYDLEYLEKYGPVEYTIAGLVD